jgi:sec-independent protein translocase protein TatA
MLGIGFPELLVIFAVCLLIFGPGKLPELGEALGKAIRDFERALKRPSDVTVIPPQYPSNSTTQADTGKQGGDGSNGASTSQVPRSSS